MKLPITELWDTELVTPRVFQLFDGTLVLTEEFTLNWHGYYVSKNDLQKLPKFLRHFGDTPSKLRFFRKVYEKIFKLFNPKKKPKTD